MAARFRRIAAAIVVGGALSLGVASVAHADSGIDTTTNPPWGGVSGVPGFGTPAVATYGQVVTVPAGNPFLQSFTFEMQQPASVVFRGEVYAWNSATQRATGPDLYESLPRSTTGTGGYEAITFTTGGVALVPGQQYVLFASTSKDQASGSGQGTWGLDDNPPDAYAGGKFVYLNSGADPSQWTTSAWQNFGGPDLAFKAAFTTLNGGNNNGGPTATPELGSGELLATGLVPLGLALLVRRRRARRAPQQ